jgi:hypothetical protein
MLSVGIKSIMLSAIVSYYAECHKAECLIV